MKTDRTSITLDRPGFAAYLSTQLRDKHLTTREVAVRSALSPDTVVQHVKGYGNGIHNTKISLWALVGIAGALDVRWEDVVEAASPGSQFDVRQEDVIKAQETVNARLLRKHSKGTATTESVKAQPAVDLRDASVRPVPSALELMQLVRALQPEDRLLVDEFIREVLAG